MKLFFAVATVLSSFAAAADHLRKTTSVEPVDGGEIPRGLLSQTYHDDDDGEPFGARILVSGLVGIPTQEDLAVLDRIVPMAFHVAHGDFDLEMTGFHSETVFFAHVDDGDDDEEGTSRHQVMIVSEFVSHGDGHCDSCCLNDPDNCVGDSSREEEENNNNNNALTAQRDRAHLDAETRLCRMLRAASDAFASAADCTFLLVPDPASTGFTEQLVYETRDHRNTAVEISLRGMTARPAEHAVQALQTALLKAHNESFYRYGYALSGLEIVSVLPYNVDDDDDDDAARWLLLGHAVPHRLRHGQHVDPTPAGVAARHREFETLFCDVLRVSGFDVFANLRHDCTFRFVYHPSSSATAGRDLFRDHPHVGLET